MLRLSIIAAVLAALAACAPLGNDDRVPPRDLGDFRLGNVVVVAPEVQKSRFSSVFTNAEIVEIVGDAVTARFAGQDGTRSTHLTVGLESVVLAQPNDPVFSEPRSVLAFHVTAWDAATGARLNPRPQRITVFDVSWRSSVLGEGLVATTPQQLRSLGDEAAEAIEEFLLRGMARDGWFLRRNFVLVKAVARAD